MKNILVINFGKENEIITSSYLIGALKENNPHAHIHLLTYSAHVEFAKTLNGIHTIHTIDSDLIQNILKNPLYSDAFAVNSFMDIIAPIQSLEWEQVVNYSNDQVSSFLISAINAKEKSGTYINHYGVAQTDDKWSLYQNYVASGMSRAAIDKVTIRNHIVKAPFSYQSERFVNNPDYTMVASQNFSRIRAMKGTNQAFVVGISLAAGFDGHQMTTEQYADLIEAIEESDDCKAVLLLDGKNYQRELANELNYQLGNSLVSINVDTVALPSVLSNIDMFVSPANHQLAMADAMDVKCIEVRECNANHLRAQSIASENYLIYAKEDKTLVSDILLAINEEYGTQLPVTSLSSTNPTYKVLHDDYGPFMTQIRGEINIKHELRYHIERSYFLQILGYDQNAELFEHIRENTDQEVLGSYIQELKSELTSTVKVLLATLRSLKGVKSSKTNLQSFIGYLDTLMSAGKTDSTVGAIIRYFEGQIENIQETDVDSNMHTIENRLFELKSNLQLLTNIMSDLTTDKPTTTGHSVQGETTA